MLKNLLKLADELDKKYKKYADFADSILLKLASEAEEICPKCGGSGKIEKEIKDPAKVKYYGSGIKIDVDCDECNGIGKIKKYNPSFDEDTEKNYIYVPIETQKLEMVEKYWYDLVYVETRAIGNISFSFIRDATLKQILTSYDMGMRENYDYFQEYNIYDYLKNNLILNKDDFKNLWLQFKHTKEKMAMRPPDERYIMRNILDYVNYELGRRAGQIND